MSCRLKLKHHDGVPVLQIRGEIRTANAGSIAHKLELLMGDKNSKVVVDLTETTFIDSYGLGAFVYAWKTMAEHQHELIFLSPQGFLRNMFEGSNLDKIFTIIDTLEKI